MKKHITGSLKFFAAMLLIFFVSGVSAQMKSYSWASYKMKFKVPENFKVDEATGTKWIGHNSTITLSIYPRKNDQVSQSDLKTALYNWTVENGVKNIDEGTEIDPQKLNRYEGFLYEGKTDDFSVETLLISDPDYPGIVFYICIHYKPGSEADVLKIVTSFTPV
ncbi:MAG TPA: hypothetical protein PKW80_09520 [Bacteroidales bacterium]|nr:hypothetical protein [Bacteroidales bacterium]